MTIVDQAHSTRPRLEILLVAQQRLRNKDAKANRHNLFEIERAVEELSCGCPNSHTDTVERWCSILLLGGNV